MVRCCGAIVILIGLSGCQTTARKNINPPTAAANKPTEDPSPILNDNSLPVKDVLEEGFCYDDIYATYLQAKYRSDKKSSIAKIKSRRRRKRARETAKSQSLFYARKTLVGGTSPYFGALPVIANNKVEFWMRYFKTRGRRTFIKWLVRSESFRDLVIPILEQEGLPPELFFLAMIESGFSNTASSRVRATGTWQFMSRTAKSYDLKINHWIDERRDPVKSTVAAARYLKDLYVRFGDWYLAMAAYNAGPGKVRSAIRRAKSRDFWEISNTRYIRKETKHYVPKVLAALNLAYNTKLHGFDVQKNPADVTPTSYVKLNRPIQIDEVATKLNLPLKTIKRWNPEIIRNITPPIRNGAPYSMRLPKTLVAAFTEIQDSLTDIEVTDVLMHKIRRGETLSAIARRYKVPVRKIKAINPKLRARALRIGKKIAVPIPGVVTKKRAGTKKTNDGEMG